MVFKVVCVAQRGGVLSWEFRGTFSTQQPPKKRRAPSCLFPLLEPFFQRGLGPNKYPRNIRCIWGWLLRGTIPKVPAFSLWSLGVPLGSHDNNTLSPWTKPLKDMIYFSGMLRRIAAKAPVMAGSTKRSDTDRHFSWRILGCVFFTEISRRTNPRTGWTWFFVATRWGKR